MRGSGKLLKNDLRAPSCTTAVSGNQCLLSTTSIVFTVAFRLKTTTTENHITALHIYRVYFVVEVFQIIEWGCRTIIGSSQNNV